MHSWRPLLSYGEVKVTFTMYRMSSTIPGIDRLQAFWNLRRNHKGLHGTRQTQKIEAFLGCASTLVRTKGAGSETGLAADLARPLSPVHSPQFRSVFVFRSSFLYKAFVRVARPKALPHINGFGSPVISIPRVENCFFGISVLA